MKLGVSRGFFGLTLALFLAFPVLAASRPTVGLALSGGGARGLAHIGVLKAFEELHVPVDYIAGTSMGSIVAGVYASGMSADEFRDEVLTIDWDRVFNPEQHRELLNLRQKQEQERYLLKFEVGFNGAPSGVIPDEELTLILRRLTRLAKTQDFDRLPIPFRAVATDIDKAESYVLKRGDLAKAMRASMAVPGAFGPVIIDGHVLMDGGILNNLPVDVVKQMGADVVIAVNISSPHDALPKNSSALSVAYQTIDAALIQNTREALKKADLVVNPDIDEFQSGDFKRAAELIQRGYDSVMNKAFLFKSLALSDEAYAAWYGERHREPGGQSLRITSVDVSGNVRNNSEVLKAETRSLQGRVARLTEVEELSRTLHAQGDFSHVDYRRRDDGSGGDALALDVTEKPWGPDYLHFGLSVTSTVGQDDDYAFLIKHERLGIGALDAEWHNELMLGTRRGYRTEFLQPLGLERNGYAAAYAGLSQRAFHFFAGDNLIADYERRDGDGGFDVGWRNGLTSDVRLGVNSHYRKFSLDTGEPNLPNRRSTTSAYRFRWLYDTLDDSNFPTSGSKVLFSSRYYAPELNNDDIDYWRNELFLRKDLPFGNRYAMFGELHVGMIDGQHPDDTDFFSLGGYGDFAGFRRDQLLGRDIAIARLGGVLPLAGNPFDFSGEFKTVFAVHVGTVSDELSGTRNIDWQTGYTLGLVWKSPLGNFLVGTGYSQGGGQLFYVTLGNLLDPVGSDSD